MTKFTVILTRDITESCVVHVEAKDAEAAEDVALSKLQGLDAPRWKLDDNWGGAPYVTDVSEE